MYMSPSFQFSEANKHFSIYPVTYHHIFIIYSSYIHHIRMPSKQHQNDKWKRELFREIVRVGFEIERTKSGAYRFTPPSHIYGPIYITHATCSSFFPIQRDLKKFYNIDIFVKNKRK